MRQELEIIQHFHDKNKLNNLTQQITNFSMWSVAVLQSIPRLR